MVTKVEVTFVIQVDDRRRNIGQVAALVREAIAGDAAAEATLLALGTGETEEVHGPVGVEVHHAVVQAHTHREAEDRS